MSNRLFQGLVYQMRDTVDRMIGVIDESATIIACSDLTKIGEPKAWQIVTPHTVSRTSQQHIFMVQIDVDKIDAR